MPMRANAARPCAGRSVGTEEGGKKEKVGGDVESTSFRSTRLLVGHGVDSVDAGTPRNTARGRARLRSEPVQAMGSAPYRIIRDRRRLPGRRHA